jgi:hypothetical protein
MPTQTSATSEDGREPPASQAWSRRAQIVFVSGAMPVLVLLLVAAPYVLTHYVVNRHYRFNYIPLPLGGDRALEGHWTDAPAVPVRRVNFGADWSAFGWIAADDDLTTGIGPCPRAIVPTAVASLRPQDSNNLDDSARMSKCQHQYGATDARSAKMIRAYSAA